MLIDVELSNKDELNISHFLGTRFEVLLKRYHKHNCQYKCNCTHSPPSHMSYFPHMVCVWRPCVLLVYVASRVQRSTIKFRVTFTPINHRQDSTLKYCLSFSDCVFFRLFGKAEVSGTKQYIFIPFTSSN